MLKRLTRKQHRYYKWEKETGEPLHAQKRLVQERARQSYWNCVDGIVTPGGEENEH